MAQWLILLGAPTEDPGAIPTWQLTITCNSWSREWNTPSGLHRHQECTWCIYHTRRQTLRLINKHICF